MSTGLSGVDLARRALAAAREAARKNGATRKEKTKRPIGTAVCRDSRAPLGLGATVGMMMAERGMVAPAIGGNVLVRFDGLPSNHVPGSGR